MGYWKLRFGSATERVAFEKIEIAKGRPIMQPIYVGESGEG